MEEKDDGGLRRRYATEQGGPEEDHVLWRLDRVELKSVGIDIGSSTSHMIFSTLEMRRQGAVLSSRFELTGRRIDYESDILITPFVDGSSINTDELLGFFEACYRAAGVRPADVDTGAVISTGDAARKDNAEAIVRLFSEQAGQFVCASAGPLLEAKMAAYGSGAVGRSGAGDGATVLNLDVGGGTAKLAVLKDGAVLETGAINVGARLITLDDTQCLTKVEKAAEIVARHRKLDLTLGKVLDPATKLELASALAESLLEAAARGNLSALTSELMITAPLTYDGKLDAVFFSGGVSEYLYATETQSYGDLGVLLGQRIRELTPTYLPAVPVETPLQRIRATVIGASQFTAQVSGNTIYINNAALLPLKNLQAVMVRFDAARLNVNGMQRSIQTALDSFEVAEGENTVALALHWPFGPAYQQLRDLCSALAGALANSVKENLPLVLILDCDIARLVGANLSEILDGYPHIICIDGIQLQDFDYVDISEEHADAGVVTVVIKSLVFTG